MDVTIVGSGPNGLTAAVICARAGLKVQVVEAQPSFGGGARTAADPDSAGVLHDICSAVHPLALASPFFKEFDLPARGVRLAVPEISYANPLAGCPAAIAYRDLDCTCAELEHGTSFRRLLGPLGPLVERSDDVVALPLGDKRSLPNSLPSALRLGLRMLAQGTPAWGSLAGEDARALFTGVAAHIISRMPSLTAAGALMMLATLAHSVGWPIPVGGSQAITDALIADLREDGGELTSGTDVTSPPGGVVAFDTAPTALLRIYGDALPARYAKALQRYTFGPGVAKVDFVRRRPSCAVAHGAGCVAAHRRPRPHRRGRAPAVLDLCPRAVRVHHRRNRGSRTVRSRLPRRGGGGAGGAGRAVV